MATATAPVEASAPVGPDPRRTGTAATATATDQVSAASLVVVRVVYGLAGAAVGLRILARGWATTLYGDPAHHLTYPGFDWVRPLPGAWSALHVGVLVVAGIGVASGRRTKAWLGLFLVAWVWLELIDAALYLHHHWFVTVLGVLLLLLPGGWTWRGTAPRWVVWAVRAQLAVVYVAAGLAKLDPDWLAGRPLDIWLAARTDRPLVGPWLDEPGVAVVAAWAGLAFDLTIVGWLVWRRSRPFAYAAVVVFHLATAVLFQIGVFPWVMIALTPVFFAPDWPHRWFRPVTGDRPTSPRTGPPPARWRAAALAAFALAAVALPLRHHVLGGDVVVDEAGYYGSFRVMLVEKTGVVTFHVTDADTGEAWRVDPGELFEPWQVSQLAARRDLLVTAAHIVAADARADGHRRVEVRADAWLSVNGGARVAHVDPTVDLAAEPRPIS